MTEDLADIVVQLSYGVTGFIIGFITAIITYPLGSGWWVNGED